VIGFLIILSILCYVYRHDKKINRPDDRQMTPSSEKTAIMHSAGPNACGNVALYLKPNIVLCENDCPSADDFEGLNGEEILPQDEIRCASCGCYKGPHGIRMAYDSSKVIFYG